METQTSQKPASILQRTVTTLPKVEAVTRLESLANDVAMQMPVRLEDLMGRTLEDMLRTPPHQRSMNDVEEIEHALTRWTKYGIDLPRTARLELCTYMGFASFLPGDIIFKQGDYGDQFYIILSGAIDVLVAEEDKVGLEKTVAHLLSGASFGELALMQGHGQRRATCRCTQATELFTVNIKDFQRILQPLQQGTHQIKMEVLQQVPEFQGLPANTVESLPHVLTEKVFPPKGVIYYQGQEVEDVFIVQSGNVKMVCELEMERKTRLSGRASSVPEWLIDQKPAPARRTSPTLHTSGSKSSPGAQGQGKTKTDQTAPTGSSGTRKGNTSPPSYHKLSLDVIKSLTGGKGTSRPPSRSAADRGAPSSASQGKDSRPQSPIRGLQKTSSALKSKGRISADAAADGAGNAGKSGNAAAGTEKAGIAVKSGNAAAAIDSAGIAGKLGKASAVSDKAGNAAKSGNAARAIDKAGNAGKSSNAAAADKRDKQQSVAPERQTTFSFDDVPERSNSPGAVKNNQLSSHATLTQNVMQQMSYTGSHEVGNRLFLEVDSLSRAEFFGEVSITKSPIAPTTAVASNVTTTVLVISKWDLMKRMPKEVVDHLTDRAQLSSIDDNDVREQYKESKSWQRYKTSIVNEVLQQQHFRRSTNPVYPWKGCFRDEAPIDRNHKPWKPNGTRGSLFNTVCQLRAS